MAGQHDLEVLNRRIEELERKVSELSKLGTARKRGFFSDFFMGFFVVLSILFWIAFIAILVSNYI